MKWSISDTCFTIFISICDVVSVVFFVISGHVERHNLALEIEAQRNAFGFYDKNVDLLGLTNQFEWMSQFGVALILLSVCALMFWLFDMFWRFKNGKRQKDTKKSVEVNNEYKEM